MNWVERIGRSIFEAPFEALDGTRDTPEMAEVRLAIFDEIKSKSHRVAGRDVFPFNQVRIHLAGVPRENAELFESKFFEDFCAEHIRTALAKSDYRFPNDLKVEIETTPELPGPKGKWLWVEAETLARDDGPPARRAAKLVVVKGSASARELPLSKARVNIGRGGDVFRTDGPSRRNDLAFDEDNAVSRTVSREHAHILYVKAAGEYRLFNDRWYTPGSKTSGNCGLWVIRDGLSQEVHRTAKGFRLQSGDEIHLGRAVLKFVLK